MAAKKKKRPAEPASLLEHLRDVLRDAVASLPGVAPRKMLVSVGWAVNDRVFALVSRDARIVVRLPDEAAAEELVALGAAPWKYGARAAPKHWLVLPESFHDDEDALRTWTRRVWTVAKALPPKKPVSPRARRGRSPGGAVAAPRRGRRSASE